MSSGKHRKELRLISNREIFNFLSLSLCRTMTRTTMFSVCLDRLANKKKMDKEEEEEARRSWCAIITCLAYSAATKSAR